MIASWQAAAEAGAPFTISAIQGLVVEVRDLAATCDFYQRLFAGGRRHSGKGTLTYERDGQFVEFVERARPRALSHTGQHQAYIVPADTIQNLAASDCWREDHPAERRRSSYLLDPSGNRVQLIPGEEGLIDHAAIELHDLELAELFYANLLGGEVDYCHGWAMDDYAEALAEDEDDAGCAPWTRRYDIRYWDKVRIRRPNMQLFVRYGATRLGLILALEHRQEPPPEQLRGTPRIVLASPSSPAALAAPYEADHGSLFLRDPGGNFVEIRCS